MRLLGRALDRVDGRTILILGLAYRADVKESYHSTSLLLADALSAAGARVLVHDPLFSHDEIRAHGLTPADLEPPPESTASCSRRTTTSIDRLIRAPFPAAVSCWMAVTSCRRAT